MNATTPQLNSSSSETRVRGRTRGRWVIFRGKGICLAAVLGLVLALAVMAAPAGAAFPGVTARSPL